MSAATLSEWSGGSGTSWIVGGSGQENLASASVMHRPLDAAPDVAREVAERLGRALDAAILPASESDTTGRAVVITGTGEGGLATPEMCIAALGLKTGEIDGIVLLDEATVSVRDWSSESGRRGFCFLDEEEDDDDDGDNEDRAKVRAATAIMASELTDHFELNFSESIVAAPVLYGGRAVDGNLVAVLSMRVWT